MHIRCRLCARRENLASDLLTRKATVFDACLNTENGVEHGVDKLIRLVNRAEAPTSYSLARICPVMLMLASDALLQCRAKGLDWDVKNAAREDASAMSRSPVADSAKVTAASASTRSRSSGTSAAG